jgi:hypothetical protein
MLMQVFNPPIIRIPPTPPPKWHETTGFWNGIILCVTLVGLGCVMAGKVILAHVFFALAWPCGALSLWIFCHGVFRRTKLAWATSALLLGIIVAGFDFYATHP